MGGEGQAVVEHRLPPHHPVLDGYHGCLADCGVRDCHRLHSVGQAKQGLSSQQWGLQSNLGFTYSCYGYPHCFTSKCSMP